MSRAVTIVSISLILAFGFIPMVMASAHNPTLHFSAFPIIWISGGGTWSQTYYTSIFETNWLITYGLGIYSGTTTRSTSWWFRSSPGAFMVEFRGVEREWVRTGIWEEITETGHAYNPPIIYLTITNHDGGAGNYQYSIITQYY